MKKGENMMQWCHDKHLTLAYIIEVRFEFDGAEDRQSVAERVGLAQDLVVERYFACREPRQEAGSKHKKQNRCWEDVEVIACNIAGGGGRVRKRVVYEQLFSTHAVAFLTQTASLKRRRRPLTCFHRFNVLQDDLHPTVEHLYGAVLGDEVLGN